MEESGLTVLPPQCCGLRATLLRCAVGPNVAVLGSSLGNWQIIQLNVYFRPNPEVQRLSYIFRRQAKPDIHITNFNWLNWLLVGAQK